MPVTMGSLTARDRGLRQRVNSAPINVGERFELELLYHDVAVLVMHRRGNGPWQHILVNNTFRNDMIPRNSDVQLSAIVSGIEKVIFKITY